MDEMRIPVMQPPERELDICDMVKGIGRKATDDELIRYFNKGKGDKVINLEIAFAKYFDQGS